MKHLVTFIFLVTFGASFAQVMPLANTPLNAAKAAIKIIPDADCTIYINGDKKGRVNSGSILRISLAKGTYTVKAVGANTVDTVSEEYRVEAIGANILLKINLQTIIDARLKKEETKKQQLANIKTIKKAMVYVEGGTFSMGMMGSTYGAYNGYPPKVHTVTVNSFYIANTEVTQAQWKAVMGTDPPAYKNCDECPVEYVTWDEANEYCRKLSLQTGKTYRLPTEAEWEYAARGGNKSRGYLYSGSNNINDVAWYLDISVMNAYPVGKKQPNELGLYDMSGNAAELCSDFYVADYFPNRPPTNPEQAKGYPRSVRGGTAVYSEESSRVAIRNFSSPGDRFFYIGFRPVMVTEPEAKTPLNIDQGDIKIMADTDCTIYINGDKKGRVNSSSALHVSLAKGTYVIKAVSGNTADTVSQDYKVEATGTGILFKIRLKNIIDGRINARLKNEEVKKQQLAFAENIKSVKHEMVYVEGGTFSMGMGDNYGHEDNYVSKDEKPVHTVTVSSFYIANTEVTQAQWKAVMGTDPLHQNCDECPVEYVTWDDANEYCRKLSLQTGKTYRLPTEAEWEYAARGGNKSRGYIYSGSNNIDEVAWYFNNSAREIHPVGQKKANELGLYDMSGNAYEWCSDFYVDTTPVDYDNHIPSYYRISPGTNPTGPATGYGYRVIRGGGWSREPIDATYGSRISHRTYHDPGYRTPALGFRPVLVP